MCLLCVNKYFLLTYLCRMSRWIISAFYKPQRDDKMLTMIHVWKKYKQPWQRQHDAERFKHLLQLEGSSLLSPQSLSRSQTHRCGTQTPLSQANWPASQVRGPHDRSSSPCRQLRRPSHSSAAGKHSRRWMPRFDGQSNVPEGHGIVSAPTTCSDVIIIIIIIIVIIVTVISYSVSASNIKSKFKVRVN